MRKFKFLFIILFVVICTGCSSKYTLTYNNDKFFEELIVYNYDFEEKEVLERYTSGSEYLVIDEKNSYQYKEDNGKKIYTYNMGKDFLVSPIIKSCFEDVFVIDEDSYINIKTDGDFYCDNNKLEVYFKTDKKVLYSNASSVEDNIYKWDDLKDGLEIHFSKVELYDDISSTTNSLNDLYIRLAISIGFIIVVTGVFIYLNKKKNMKD